MPGRKSVSSATLPNAAQTRACEREHALAVGPDDAHAAFLDGALQLGFELATLGAGLAETGREHHGMADPGPPQSRIALATAGAGTAMMARSHGCPIDWASGIALEAVHLLILRIDQKDAAFVAGVLHGLDADGRRCESGRMRRR